MSSRVAKDTSNHPYVENYPPLREWLDKHDGRCMWQIPMQCEHARQDRSPPTAYIEMWMFPKSNEQLIIEVRSNKMGWNIYSSTTSHEIYETLADAERRLGIGQP